MKVIELIRILNDMPHNAEIKVMENNDKDFRNPQPESVWNDIAENYVIVI